MSDKHRGWKREGTRVHAQTSASGSDVRGSAARRARPDGTSASTVTFHGPNESAASAHGYFKKRCPSPTPTPPVGRGLESWGITALPECERPRLQATRRPASVTEGVREDARWLLGAARPLDLMISCCSLYSQPDYKKIPKQQPGSDQQRTSFE